MGPASADRDNDGCSCTVWGTRPSRRRVRNGAVEHYFWASAQTTTG
jgi:hypothetical protein